ncbi:MAG: hypothetical protein RLZZ490_2334 [Cyanobacteriota bacterium]
MRYILNLELLARIPDYHTYQQLGIPIGSGDVESRIKQVSARVKLSGARWNRENVPQILRLRCAYLNRSAPFFRYINTKFTVLT